MRKSGDRYELTRKRPVSADDVSAQTETTIELTAAEFANLANIRASRVAKTRYYYQYGGRTAEFDVFADTLAGLVLVDVEFDTEAEKDAFVMPDFCLEDITQETFIAGGALAGKTYEDIAANLARFNYQRL